MGYPGQDRGRRTGQHGQPRHATPGSAAKTPGSCHAPGPATGSPVRNRSRPGPAGCHRSPPAANVLRATCLSPVCNRCYHWACWDPGWPRGASRAGWDGGRGAEPSGYVYRRGAVLAGRGRVAAWRRRRHRAGPGPGGPRPGGRQRRSLSSCHRFRIRSRQARVSGPAACNGHRQPQPDARHCERHNHGDGDGEADGVRSCGSPG